MSKASLLEHEYTPVASDGAINGIDAIDTKELIGERGAATYTHPKMCAAIDPSHGYEYDAPRSVDGPVGQF